MGTTSSRWWERLPVLIAIAAVVVIGATTAAVVSPALRSALGLRVDVERLGAGDALAIEGWRPNPAGYSLVFFGRGACGECQAAKPMLAELVRVAGASGLVEVVMVAPTPVGTRDRDLAASIGLDGGLVLAGDFASFKVPRVPTLVLVDREGVVAEVWGPDAVATRPADVLARVRHAVAR